MFEKAWPPALLLFVFVGLVEGGVLMLLFPAATLDEQLDRKFFFGIEFFHVRDLGSGF